MAKCESRSGGAGATYPGGTYNQIAGSDHGLLRWLLVLGGVFVVVWAHGSTLPELLRSTNQTGLCAFSPSWVGYLRQTTNAGRFLTLPVIGTNRARFFNALWLHAKNESSLSSANPRREKFHSSGAERERRTWQREPRGPAGQIWAVWVPLVSSYRRGNWTFDQRVAVVESVGSEVRRPT